MRLSDTQVVQLIERDQTNDIVIVDEETGAEIVLDPEAFHHLYSAMLYFAPYMGLYLP